MTNTNETNPTNAYNDFAQDMHTTAIPAVEQPSPTTPNPAGSSNLADTAASVNRKKTILHVASGFIAAAILITPTTWMIASQAAQNSTPGMSQMGQPGQGGAPGGPGNSNGQMSQNMPNGQNDTADSNSQSPNDTNQTAPETSGTNSDNGQSDNTQSDNAQSATN
ncbi:hypothetical protein EJ419_07650 [Alloscardovia theropitheci]|uniref:Uncharacterized protein n=1 Tax=Alloscardovia theropitheci TaxID=2496842 RepID=A0A4R0QWE4_9BIFI|nr:hypothetical protein [Alloscardovia theropitheci]TCD53830.1 hypothetical protein EJ419_07650 [Alloscardovia theropitheci]